MSNLTPSLIRVYSLEQAKHILREKIARAGTIKAWAAPHGLDPIPITLMKMETNKSSSRPISHSVAIALNLRIERLYVLQEPPFPPRPPIITCATPEMEWSQGFTTGWNDCLSAIYGPT